MASFPCHHFQSYFNHNKNLPSFNRFLNYWRSETRKQTEEIRAVGNKEDRSGGKKSHHTCELALRRQTQEEHTGSKQKSSVGETNHFCLDKPRNERAVLAKGSEEMLGYGKTLHLQRVNLFPFLRQTDPAPRVTQSLGLHSLSFHFY